MKKIIFAFMFLASISFSVENVAFVKNDKGNDIYTHIELLRKDFRHNGKFFNSYSNLFLDNRNYELNVKYENQYLVNLILQNIRGLSEFNIDIKSNFLRDNLDGSPITLNYFGVISTVSNQFLSYDAAWNSKTAKANYLADEIFIYLNVSNKFEDRLEEVIANMKVNYPDYPLNKYNSLIFNMTHNKDKIQKNDFKEARKDIRKISDKFYPELSLHKLRILWNIALMQIDYFEYKKDIKGLEELKKEIKKSNKDILVGIEMLVSKIDEKIDKLGR